MGPPITQLQKAEEKAGPGECVMSPELWALVAAQGWLTLTPDPNPDRTLTLSLSLTLTLTLTLTRTRTRTLTRTLTLTLPRSARVPTHDPRRKAARL